MDTGKYRLMEGDCLELMKSIPAGSVDAVITDPPYGMDWDTDNTRFTMGPNGHGAVTRRTYPRIEGDAEPFDPSPWLCFPKVVLFGYQHFASRLPVGTVLVWLKRLDGGFGSFLSDAELAFMKGGCGVYAKRDTSLLAQTKRRVHPAQKPASLMRWCLDMAKVPVGATVLDPYMGSGSTGVACLQTGRNFIGIEKDPTYYKIACDRLSEAAAQGRLFDSLTAEDDTAEPAQAAMELE